MGLLVNGVLELAERMAKRHIPMTKVDCVKQIDTILALVETRFYKGGQVTAEQAKEYA